MDRIISRVEKDPRWPQLMAAEHADESAPGDLSAIAHAATRAAAASNAACLVAFTAGGATGRRLSRERPLQQILVLTPSIQTARKLALAWGVEPRVAKDPANVEEMVEEAIEESRELGIAREGQTIVIVAGVPFGRAGSTNMLRIAHV
jgi:pyruvate kinase